MKKCGRCGLTYPDECVYCNNCGTVLETVQPKKKGSGATIAIVILSILTFSFFVGMMAVISESDSGSDSSALSAASQLKKQVSSLNAVVSAQKGTIQSLTNEVNNGKNTTQSSASGLEQQVSSLNAVVSAQKETLRSLESENAQLSSQINASKDSTVTVTNEKLQKYMRAPSDILKVKQSVYMIDVGETVQIDVYWNSSDTIWSHNFSNSSLETSWTKEWNNSWTQLNVTGLVKGHHFIAVCDQNEDESIGENSIILLVIVK